MATALPARIEGPGAWIGTDMAAEPARWRLDFGPGEIEELEAAGRAYLATGRDIGAMRAADYPLGALGLKLLRVRETLRTGCGVQVLRRLPVDRWDRALAAAVFCGIGAHLGRARSQNAAGHVLGHVRDTGADAADPTVRIYQTRARQSFHTDSADVVGLLCLKTAREGGRSLLVSAETLYNRIRAARPDLLPLLFDPLSTDRRGEVPVGAAPFFSIPPLSWHRGRLTVCYQRQYIDSAQRFPEAFVLTPAHVAALDLFDAMADDPELHFAMDLAPGDMQFVHNHRQLHDRTAFVDWPEPDRRRHLLRLWLALPGDRPLPPSFAERYGDLTPGDRGGIVVPGTRLHAPLD
ncbi:TauD/TfdA family dioxygenase [Rhodobacteraceae bacterium CCMM004]|nr:TauD/TfdA family dioxygenase [Rhodobacteraceae bacterium CCMM004]